MRDPQYPVTIVSETGKITSDVGRGSLSVALSRGTLHRSSADSVQTIAFDTYDLNLPLETPQTNPLAKIGRSTMMQNELLAEADRLGRNSTRAASFLNEYHKRLALPVSCFILTILGFPLGFLSGPRYRSIGIPLGLAIFILYYVFLTAAKTLSESLFMPAAAAMWLPNLLFLFLTIYFIRLVAREKHNFFLERFSDTINAILSKLGRSK